MKKERVIQVVFVFFLLIVVFGFLGSVIFLNQVYSSGVPVEIRVENTDYSGIKMSNSLLWQVFLKQFGLGKSTQFTYRLSSQNGGKVVEVNGINRIVFILADKPQDLYKVVSNSEVMQSFNLNYITDSKTLEITGYWSEEGLSVLPGKLPQKLSVATVNALAFVSSQAHGVSITEGKENVSDAYDAYLTTIQKRYYSLSYISLYKK